MCRVTREEELSILHGLDNETSHSGDAFLKHGALGEFPAVRGLEPGVKFLPDSLVRPVVEVFFRLALKIKTRNRWRTHAEQRKTTRVVGVDEFFRRGRRLSQNAEPGERVNALKHAEDSRRDGRPANAVKTVAAADKIAGQFLGGPRVAVSDPRLPRRSLKIMYLDVVDIKENAASGSQSRFDQVLQDLVLCIDHNRLAAGEGLEINAVAAAGKLQFDPMMYEALLHHSLANTSLIQEIDGTLFKYAGTDAFFDIASAASFEDNGFNVFKVQEVREQQPSWPGTDNADLCSHCSHFRRMASSLLDLQTPGIDCIPRLSAGSGGGPSGEYRLSFAQRPICLDTLSNLWETRRLARREAWSPHDDGWPRRWRMSSLAKLNQQYIGGVWRDGSSSKVLADTNPFNGNVVARFKLASLEDLDEAYRSARDAQKVWASINPFEKRAILERGIAWIEKNEGDITELIIEELGGTHLKAFIEILLAKSSLKEASTYPLRMKGEILPSTIEGKENRLYRVPVGVVGVISPFNFPFILSMRSVAAALGAGNGVVLKPHDDSAITGGTLLAKVFEEAGLPKGLLNVIVADIAEIGDAFVEHPIPRVISFTGSEPVGRHIGEVAGRCLKKAILELGGNSAMIVMDDADLDLAINAAVFSRFAHQGQICMCSNRVLVQRGVYNQFLQRFVDRVAKLKVGDPSDPQTEIGPLINARQAQAFAAQLQRGIDEGARVALRGKVEGNVASPTVFADVRSDMWLAQNELFGPAVCVMPFDTPEEAIRIANETPYGLSGAIHTRNAERGAELAKEIDSGMVHVNDGTINDEPLVAFGGEKASGVGRLNGQRALEEFTTLKRVSVQHTPRHYPFEAAAKA